MADPGSFRHTRAVTFDCWNTLLYEPDPQRAHGWRVDALVEIAARVGAEADPATVRVVLETVWLRHIQLWQRGVSTGPGDIAGWSLRELGSEDAGAVGELTRAFAEASLATEILPLEGARATLERLAACGVRRALVCDTGFSPGPVVRELLDRSGLLDLLEVQIFSDEEGVPKPHRRMFEAALAPLGVEPAAAVHVGDLRRTDVAGAREVGMRTIRIRDRHDDDTDLPEADAVADTHAHLLEILGVGTPAADLR
jgi:putative hydrolase of the HAD superfamily